jgi:hypothetical protein
VRIVEKIVEFAVGLRRYDFRSDHPNRGAGVDIPGCRRQRPVMVVLDIAVLLGAHGTSSIEGVVIGLRTESLVAHRCRVCMRREQVLRMRNPIDARRFVDSKQPEQRG